MNNIIYFDKKKIKFCIKFKDRLIGMMLNKNKKNFVYCFPKCNSIHTFFMLRKIDVIMTDKQNNIIKCYQNIKPCKLIFPQKNVYYVYETNNNFITNIENYKKIEIK